MKQDRFVAQHEATWTEYEALLDGLTRRRRGKGAKAKTPPAPTASVLVTLPARYRVMAQHLALARARGYSLGLIERLEHLTLRGHQVIYQRRDPFGAACLSFVTSQFPRQLRSHWKGLSAAATLFFGSMLASALLVYWQPDATLAILGAEQIANMEQMYDPAARRLGRDRGAGNDVVMFGFYIRNNTGIGFQTFAGGIAWGIGTVFFLLFNGLHIGAVAGHLSANGFAVPFWSFVSGHSAFELTAIVISGAAGLALGWSLVHPGAKSRIRSLADCARDVIGLVYGAAILFLFAAFVEAFWSSLAQIDPQIKYTVGVVAWIAMALYIVFAGRGGSDGA
ncbi:MAG: putative membrane protein SpoIIM required for sporulation [Gammaproteobacteria bacterium]